MRKCISLLFCLKKDKIYFKINYFSVFFKHKEIFLTKDIPRLVFRNEFRNYFVCNVRNTHDNLTLATSLKLLKWEGVLVGSGEAICLPPRMRGQSLCH